MAMGVFGTARTLFKFFVRTVLLDGSVAVEQPVHDALCCLSNGFALHIPHYEVSGKLSLFALCG